MTTLSVMTFNTGNDFVKPSVLLNFLRESNADIIGLQEVSPHNADALQALADIYPYRIQHGKYFDGKALLSRFPIRSHALFTVHLPRPHLEASLEVEGQLVKVYVVHLPAPNYRRMELLSAECATELAGLLKKCGDGIKRPAAQPPTLFLGDFNTVENTPIYHTMRQAGFMDSFRQVSRERGYTFPTRFQYLYIPLRPMVRLDYIWASSHFKPLASKVGSGHGSDHLPVISTLALHVNPE